MTQQEQFIEMLKECGHEYTVSDKEITRFSVRQITNLIALTLITVQGTFYDELYAYFDDDGKMVEMQSHVAFSYPATPKLKKLLGVEDA